jgi:hypothetical protein
VFLTTTNHEAPGPFPGSGNQPCHPTTTTLNREDPDKPPRGAQARMTVRYPRITRHRWARHHQRQAAWCLHDALCMRWLHAGPHRPEPNPGPDLADGLHTGLHDTGLFHDSECCRRYADSSRTWRSPVSQVNAEGVLASPRVGPRRAICRSLAR